MCIEHNDKKAVLKIKKSGYEFGLCKECVKSHIEKKENESSEFAKMGLYIGKDIIKFTLIFILAYVIILLFVHFY